MDNAAFTCDTPQGDRRGVTLIELLVTIAILGLLVALLLPAVQSSRESARRTQCNANLKQIGVGLQSYAQASGDMLPAGEMAIYSYASGKTFAHGSATMYLLPFIEQLSLYLAYDMSEPSLTYATIPARDNGWQNLPGTTKAVNTVPIATYLCPSDYALSPVPAALTNYGTARLNYIGCTGPQGDVWLPCSGGFAALFNAYKKSNTGSIRKPGVFADYNYTASKWPNYPTALPAYADGRCRLAAIQDGLSNTIMFGEARPDCSFSVFMGWSSAGNACGRGNTLVPLNYDSCNSAAYATSSDCSIPFNLNPAGFGFKSRHQGGVSFLLGDGGVKFITEDIEYGTLQLLGAKADRELLSAY